MTSAKKDDTVSLQSFDREQYPPPGSEREDVWCKSSEGAGEGTLERGEEMPRRSPAVIGQECPPLGEIQVEPRIFLFALSRKARGVFCWKEAEQMDLLSLEKEVGGRLERLDFDSLWPGFRQYEFALYDDERAVLNGELFPRPQDFWANTALPWQGRRIAVWGMREDLDLDVLASKLAHEMFHAYQMEQGEGRFANELQTAGRFHPTPELLQLCHEENRLLVSLAGQFGPGAWERLLSLRRTRQERFPYEYDYQCRVEAIEGSAQYVELAALHCLAPEKYTKALELLIDKADWLEPLFSLRPMCYDTGALLLLILVQNGLPLDRTVGPDAPFFAQALVEAAPPLPSPPEPCPALLAAVRDHEKTLRRRAARICAHGVRRRGSFRLLGFNCYDPQRLGDYVFSGGYLAYENENGEQVVLTEDAMFRMEGDRLTEVIGAERSQSRI